MALSDLILSAGEVIVVLSSSTTGVVAADGGVAINFGTIQKVSDLSDYTVGESVMFTLEKATPFTMISANLFYLINENDIRLTEITPP